MAGVCISRLYPGHVRKKFGLEAVPIWWLAESPGEEHYSANAMALLARTIQKFVQDNGSTGLVLLDGLEFIIIHNGFLQTLITFVEHLNEFVMGSTKAVVLIAFRPDTVDPKDLALLERNLEVLDGQDVKRQLDSEDLGDLLGGAP